MTTAERVCGSYTATTVTLVRYLTCMRRPGRPFSARPVLFASSCAGARVRLGPAAAPGGIRIMINHRALAWSGEVPLRAHFDTIACLASVLKFARCSPFRFWTYILIFVSLVPWVLDGLLSSSRPTKGECHLSSECHRVPMSATEVPLSATECH